MAFDYSTLIIDRAASDSDALRALVKKPMSQWTAAEAEAFTAATLKGSYDYTDLNRVSACMEDLVARLNGLGYQVPGYERVKIQRTVKPTSRLPEGYTEVQYIQSSGTQWVNTNLKATSNTRVVMDVEPLDSVGAAFFGGRTNGNAYSFAAWISNATQFRSDFCGSGDDKVYANVSSVLGRYVVDKNKNVCKVGTYTMTNTEKTFSCAYPLYLLAANTAGSSLFPLNAKLYSCQIYDNDTLVRDFIPCINPSGTVGLYDTVTKAFFGNSGTGVFYAGPRKVALPEGYTEVQYIQSSGTQYTDTGFKPNQDTRVFVDVVFPAQSSAAWLYGARNENVGRTYGFLTFENAYRSDYNNTVTEGAISNVPSGRFTIDKNKNITKFDNSTVNTAQKGTFQCTHNLFVFANNNNGTVGGKCVATLYSCQIYDNDTLVRDYIPCVNASGEVGLYDLVTKTFFGNAGTGSFTAGSAVTGEVVTPSDSDAEDLDPYLWYPEDAPTQPQIEQYRGNVAAVRAVLAMPDTTPEVPETLRKPHTYDANNIEAILIAIDQILTHIPAARRHCGVTVCGLKGVIA